MKNKTKLHRPTRQPRRFPAQATHQPAKRPEERHDFLVLSFYPGMPARSTNTVAA